MTPRLDYRWHLRKVMAERGMFATTDIIPLLADRGITLSSSQVYRLVVERPERLSLKILMALLDILDCTMDDLIEPVPAASASRRPRKAAAGGARGCRRHRRPAPQAGPDHWRAAVTSSPGEAAGPVLAVMAKLEPALSPEVILGALREAAARPDGQRRIAAAVVDQPELLTGQGARAAFPGVLRFISALARAGAAAVVEPHCPRCGRQRQLGVPVEGLRLCGGCLSKARALPCGRCGKLRSTARRNDNGQPICQNCWRRDPRSWKPCVTCGNRRRVAALTEAGPVCQSCRPGPALSCTICGSAGSGRIGISRATGTPVCERCRKRWITCSRCGTGAPLKGGTLREPLCAHCLNPDPAFWKRCAACQETWQLSAAECTRCSLDRKLKLVFTPPGGAASPELDRLREALVGVDRPDLMLDWLKKASVRRTLHSVAACGVITHEALDTLPPGRTLVHLRSLLVAVGALPARDERLIALERWISQVSCERAVPEHRRALHGYAVWHQLRRLTRSPRWPARLPSAGEKRA